MIGFGTNLRTFNGTDRITSVLRSKVSIKAKSVGAKSVNLSNIERKRKRKTSLLKQVAVSQSFCSFSFGYLSNSCSSCDKSVTLTSPHLPNKQSVFTFRSVAVILSLRPPGVLREWSGDTVYRNTHRQWSSPV